MRRKLKPRSIRELSILRCRFLVLRAGKQIALSRISIKDQQTSIMIEVELSETPELWGEKRFRLRVNDRESGESRTLLSTKGSRAIEALAR